MSSTATAHRWWLTRAEQAGAKWAEYYWNDWKAPHRQQIILALGLLGPVNSLYELGCNSGPNLRLIWHYFPHLKLGGIEATKIAADMAHGKLGVPITLGKLPEELPDEDWDVVLSCYTMAYLDPEDAHLTMLKLNRMAQRALILVEPCPVGACPIGPCREDGLPEWRHDYEKTFRTLGWTMTWKWPLMPPVQNLNTLLVLER